ncbi:MAG: hypothetical protein WCX63_01050 [Methanoregula sp.]
MMMTCPANLKCIPVRAAGQLQKRPSAGVLRGLILIALVIALVTIPASAGAGRNSSALSPTTTPDIVHIGIYVVDFNRFSVEEGTYETNFYMDLISDANVSIDDFDLMNGQISSIDTITDTPHEKEYRIYAVMTADPDLRLYPFDKHALPIIIEPRTRNENNMVLTIDDNNTGLDTEADLPGWALTGTTSLITNRSYVAGETPYSRAVFSYGITRDAASTILKFFLPITLIIIVSLTSLLMRVSSRLGLNASMFLAAVLIHWRIADAIPLVAYATFLDYFMILTYATLVMVLVSGILILKFSEDKNTIRVEHVNRWSIRIVPALSISLYFLLFLSILG